MTAIEAFRRWHQAQEHRAQAQASGRAGRLLREAVEVTAGASAARAYRPRPKRTAARSAGTRRPPAAAGERPMAGVVQQALPQYARMVLADAAWPALRTRLAAVERADEDPVDVLAAVAARREMTSADSVAEVLTWRLDGWQRQRGATVTSGTSPTAAEGRGGAARTTGTPAVTRRPPGGEQHPGPRRAR
ncbi:hypothetical protein AB0B21_33060 [Streptomyces rimosus]|uniref:hypothetical protein n=1 Tax=Streptomyces rimosus TaxID=1927 RepID=UPI000518DEA2|nr:hypothetical protein [Streptomyces rimosus]